jgi:hypothetical protein
MRQTRGGAGRNGGEDLAGAFPMEVRARHGAGVSEKAPPRLVSDRGERARERDEETARGTGEACIRGELCKFRSRFAATLPQESRGIPGGTRRSHERRR